VHQVVPAVHQVPARRTKVFSKARAAVRPVRSQPAALQVATQLEHPVGKRDRVAVRPGRLAARTAAVPLRPMAKPGQAAARDLSVDKPERVAVPPDRLAVKQEQMAAQPDPLVPKPEQVAGSLVPLGEVTALPVAHPVLTARRVVLKRIQLAAAPLEVVPPAPMVAVLAEAVPSTHQLRLAAFRFLFRARPAALLAVDPLAPTAQVKAEAQAEQMPVALQVALVARSGPGRTKPAAGAVVEAAVR
jgi:hypothetical protein